MAVIWVNSGGVWRAPGDSVTVPTTANTIYGSTNNQPNEGLSTTSITDWLAIQPRMTPAGVSRLIGRRTFNANMPATLASSPAAQDEANNLISFWSFKQADVTGVINGNYYNALTTLGASIPDGSYVTSYAEPEAQAAFTGANEGKFVDYFRAIYAGIKNGNPNVNVGYVAMAYQWGTARGHDWVDWYPGDAYSDFLGVDVYDMEGDTVGTDVSGKADFMRWHGYATATGKPLQVWEWGVTWGTKVTEYPAGRTDASVAPYIAASMDWYADNGYNVILYWNVTDLGTAYPDGSREWAISGTYGTVGDNRPLSRQAWLDGLTAYGLTRAEVA